MNHLHPRSRIGVDLAAGPRVGLQERAKVVRAMAALGLDTYVYAPKDDPYHRARLCERGYPLLRRRAGLHRVRDDRREDLVTVERQLPGRFGSRVSYVGTHGSNLVENDPVNALVPRALAPGPASIGLAALGGGARLLLHFLQRRISDQAFAWHEVLLIPLRDALLLMEWAAALAGWQVRWRGQVLHARGDGSAP